MPPFLLYVLEKKGVHGIMSAGLDYAFCDFILEFGIDDEYACVY